MFVTVVVDCVVCYSGCRLLLFVTVTAEEKRKLPAGRVGAKFDHKQSTCDTWLPMFGRVWDSQRRLHSK